MRNFASYMQTNQLDLQSGSRSLKDEPFEERRGNIHHKNVGKPKSSGENEEPETDEVEKDE